MLCYNHNLQAQKNRHWGGLINKGVYMSRKDESEIEIKREMVRLLLNTSHFKFQKIDQVTESADKLTKFIIEKNQS